MPYEMLTSLTLVPGLNDLVYVAAHDVFLSCILDS